MHRNEALGVRYRRSRSARRALAVTLVIVVPLVAAACSSDSDGAKEPARTTTTKVARTSTSTSTTTEATTTTAATATTAAPTTKPGAGPTAYAGRVDGQKESVRATFTRTAAGVTDFVVSGLSIECQPLDNSDPSTRVTKVSIPLAPLRADGSVETSASGSTYEPTLSGSFTSDGSFAGGLFLSGEDDGSVCGGEFSFIATPV